MSKKKFIIIDANSLIHRAFHALPPLTARNGEVVNAVYGFTTIFLKALKDFKPDYIVCCFDVDKDTFRKKEYAEYKAHRKEQPSELYHQFPLIKQLLEAFRVPVYEKQGFEADDIIGTISKIINKKYKENNIKNIIVSGDMDILQLVDSNTEVYTMKRGISDTIIYNEDAVMEKFGFGPCQVVDYKALRGDPSDNIPGVAGIGEKTATDLIKEFKSLDNIYKVIEKLSNQELKGDEKIKPAVLDKLIKNKKQAYLSQMLARIVRGVDIDFNLEDAKVEEFNTTEVIDLFQAWKFTSLISKIPQAEKIMFKKQGNLFQPVASSQQLADFKMKQGYNLVDDDQKFNNFLNKLEKQEEFVFDTETDSLDVFNSKLLGVSFCWESGEAYYVINKFLNNNKLKNIFKNPNIKKIAHNLKFDYEVLKTFGFDVRGLFFDTMLASYLLNPGTRQHSLDALAFTELGYKMQPITDLIGEKKSQQISLADVQVERVANYSCEDADITWQLYGKLSEKLDDAIIEGVLQKIEVPLVPVLAEMEKNGVKIDLKFLDKMSIDLGKRIIKLEKEIYSIAGQEFNVASPKQLKEILFDKLKISVLGLGKTKTGVSTAAGELDKLKGKHKIIDLIIEFRELSKLKNTYLDPLPKLVDKRDRIHTSFNQTITATGRLSSSNPNLQNIPIRTELGKEIRKAFIAEKRYSILAVDYSQIELRIVASLANDKKMIRAFEKKADIHTETAAAIFGIKPEKVSKEVRRQAKAVNFGVIYGQGPRGLATGTGISYDEAQNFIEKYFEVYDGIKNYIEETIVLTRELGYTETLLGRRRYLPEINAHHPQLRSQAERMAINMPVQGFAADLIKLAMINLHKRLQTEFVSGQVRMLLQVHDELVFEVKDDLIKHAEKIIKTEMEQVYKLRVPIEVEIGVGKNWGEAK